MNILTKIASLLATPIFFLGNLIAPHVQQIQPPVIPSMQTQNVGATLPQATGVFETSLATPITATATSMTLTANSVRGGGVVAGYTCFTVDEGSAQAEVMCGTVSTTSVTSITRGISYSDGITSVPTNEFSHRRGANVKITDFPLVQILKAQNNGEATYPNPITYATGVSPLNSQDLATKAYVLSVVNGGPVSFSQVIVAGTAGENVVAGNLVYLKSDGKWWKTSANTITTTVDVQLGIAQGTGTAGGIITNGVLEKGIDTNNTGTGGNYAYVSNSSGVVGTSAGTYSKIIGQFILSSAGLYFDPTYYLLTGGISQGVYSSKNKVVSQDNIFDADTDQTQTTQNSSIEVGMANSTSNKNSTAESFVPLKTKIRGVKLYKSADTGTFTGTVTVSLQADSSGSPSGSALATVTLTNYQYETFSVGEFEADFGAEYETMTQGSLYWIVVSTSTSDSSNHPNLGDNTAGGYTSGSVKYNNTTDGWVAVSTINLYFKTLEGVISQVVQTDSTNGLVPSKLLSYRNLPVPNFQQVVPSFLTAASPSSVQTVTGSNSDGSVIYVMEETSGGGGTWTLSRLARDSITGMYYRTHNITSAINGYATSAPTGTIIQIGSFIYVFYANTNIVCYRYSATDLTGQQLMTVPTVTATGVTAWTDGINAYVVSASTATTSRKWSVSGTTFTAVTTATSVGSLTGTSGGYSTMFDGSNIYVFNNTAPATSHIIYKLADPMAVALTSTTTIVTGITNYYSSSPYGSIITPIGTDRMYLGTWSLIFNATAAYESLINLLPFSKP